MKNFLVIGTVEVSVPVELPESQKDLNKLALLIGYAGKVDHNKVAKFIALEAIGAGLHNLSEHSNAEEYNLQVEED